MRDVVLLDPSLMDHSGTVSTNLGDVIISRSITRALEDLFGKGSIVGISTHDYLTDRHYRLIRESKYVFLGGTNLLYSRVESGMNWRLSPNRYFYAFPKINNLILFGVGYAKYDGPMSWRSKLFYNRLLSRRHLHSVRDGYTKDKMDKALANRTFLNTSCPTTWSLDGYDPNRKQRNCTDCLFMLTDYAQDIVCDERMISAILQLFTGKIYFFPQGLSDEDYLKSLGVYARNKARITVLARDINLLSDVLHEDINYIGTRLHGGIMCLSRKIDSVIISVDNRAEEIARDIHLPVIKRGQESRLLEWYDMKIKFEAVALPKESIEKWSRQFEIG